VIRLNFGNGPMPSPRNEGSGDTSSKNSSRSEAGSRSREDGVKLGQGQGMETPMDRMKALRSQMAPVASKAGNRSEDLRRAMNALPRDIHGMINPDILVDEDKNSSLSQAVERLVMEGLGTGADIAFEHAVHSLFAEYADDLALDETEFSRAKELMLKEVRDVIADNQIRPWAPDQPAPAMMDLEAAVEMLQERVMGRRRLMLEASGDLSRVLAELTVTAQKGDNDDLAQLGGFLQRFGTAVRARSAKHLRDEARDRLLSPSSLLSQAPKDDDWGTAFLKHLESSQVA